MAFVADGLIHGCDTWLNFSLIQMTEDERLFAFIQSFNQGSDWGFKPMIMRDFESFRLSDGLN